MRYRPKEKKIEIPISFSDMKARETRKTGEHIHFWSHGMDYDTDKGEIYFPKARAHDRASRQNDNPGAFGHCLIHRHTNLGGFLDAR